MLRIRLMRPGKSIKARHHYKIVVIESEKARDANFIEQLGYYNPSRKLYDMDLEAYHKWIEKGAQPSETVAALAKNINKKKVEK
jgi:small subunit ribosomal protein S16